MNPGQSEKVRHPLDEAAFTRMLRVAGGVLLFASASTFMLQHWEAGNDLARYALLVGHSVLLALAAYFCGLRVNESRGARTFLALVLAIVPTTFAVLGGLVYSRFHWEPIQALPSYARWVAPTDVSALLAVAGTLVVVVPLAAIAFVALGRKDAKVLTLAFVAQNLLLLLPVRSPSVIVLVFGASVAMLTELELRRFSRVAQLSTLEGRLARASLFVAPALLLGRAVHLYDPSRLFVGGVLLTAAYVLFAYAPKIVDWAARDAAAFASAGLGVVGWIFCFSGFAKHLDSEAVSVVALGLPSALLVTIASRRAVQLRPVLTVLGGTMALLTAVIAPLVELSIWGALACIVTGVSVLAWGAARRSIPYTVAGAVVGLVGVGLQVSLAVQVNEFMRWGSLTVGGVLLIVGASFAERYKGRLTEWFRPASERDAA
jgi:hypothetical protein